MAKKRILIVEDEGIVALDLKQMVERIGYTVPAVVRSGEDAVEQATALQPDLILMDIRLKGEMDGVDATETIQEQIDIPVVYVTAFVDRLTLKRARSTQPQGYVFKPLDPQELKFVIKQALNDQSSSIGEDQTPDQENDNSSE
jgi:CheY-like chemotaxis protein